jgi:hypothetical protein
MSEKGEEGKDLKLTAEEEGYGKIQAHIGVNGIYDASDTRGERSGTAARAPS